MSVVEIPDPNSPSGLAFLDERLRSRSYVSGHAASQADAEVFRALRSEPKDSEATVNVLRWYRHLKALDRKALPEAGKDEKVVVMVSVTEKKDEKVRA